MPIPAETHANTPPDTPPSMGDKINISIALMLAAYLCFALSDTTTKAMVLYGMPVFQLAFVRYVVQFTITWARFPSVAFGARKSRKTGRYYYYAEWFWRLARF